jgi:hypothetical protein
VIPMNELWTLKMTLAEADDLAAEGQLADGYACLLWGRERAEGIAAEGLAWGLELAERWGQACEDYAERYGVRIE